MKKILLVVVLGLSYWYWQHGALPFGMAMPFASAPSAHDAAGDPSVWLFTFKGCGKSCDLAVKDLTDRGVVFEEKQLDAENRSGKEYDQWKSFNLPESFPALIADTQVATGYSADKYTQLLAKAFDGAYLNSTQKRYYAKHFNEDGTPRIVMYAASWCGYCAKLRKELNNNQVDFTEIDVEKSGEKELLSQAMGVSGYPTTYVGYSRVANSSDYSAVVTALRTEMAGQQPQD